MWKKPGAPPPIWRHICYGPLRDEYVYFEGLPQGDDLSEYERAGRMADAAMLAYGRVGPQRMPPDEARRILHDAGLAEVESLGDWGSGGGPADGFAAGNDSYGMVVFRGTEKRDWCDFMTDLMVMPMPAASERGVGAMVHCGFQAATDLVWAAVERWVNRYRDRHPGALVYFVGHSLGAAMASIVASRFRGNWRRLYTFGCPRVGNARFCARLGALCQSGSAFRFVNSSDIVPHLPHESVLYTHPGPGGVRYIHRDGRIYPSAPAPPAYLEIVATIRAGVDALLGGIGDENTASEPLANHGMVRYCYRIWNTAQRAVGVSAS